MTLDRMHQPYEQRDYTPLLEATVTISSTGDVIWVDLDGINVLRINKSPIIEIVDHRSKSQEDHENDQD